MTDSGVEGFITLDESLDDVVEPKPVATGRYNLTIEQAKAVKNEEGELSKIQILIGFDDNPKAATLFHNISLPLSGDQPKSRNFKLLLMKKFMTLFKVPYEGGRLNTLDFAGCRAEGVNVEYTTYQKSDQNGQPVGDPVPTNRIVF